MQMTEVSATFRCFGGTCAVLVSGDGADDAVAEARRRLLPWHDRFTRFEPSDRSPASLPAWPLGSATLTVLPFA